MNVIDQIIDELTDTSKSLMGPILKTKVFASRIGNQEVASWADREATGYRDQSDEVPSYRFTRSVFRSTYSQATIVKRDVPLPLSIFDDDTLTRYFTNRLEGSVSALELMLERGRKEGYIRKEYGDDICQLLTHLIVSNPPAPISITALTIITDISEVAHVLAAIRSKLLNFMLKLEKELPELDTARSTSHPLPHDEQAKVTNIFHQAIFVSGDNNTVTSGKDIVVQ